MKHIPKAFKSEHPSGTGLNGRTYTSVDTEAALSHIFQHIDILEQKIANQAGRYAALLKVVGDSRMRVSYLEDKLEELDEYKSNKLFKRKPIAE